MPTVTIGAIDYDVYADVATADAYYNGSTEFSAWNAFDTDSKARGLVSGTRLIDRQQWGGTKADESPTTDHAFAREGLTDCAGNSVTAEESLELAIESSILLALDTLSEESTTQSSGTEDLTRRLKAGSVEIEFFRAEALVPGGPRFAVDVMEQIGSFFASSGLALAGSCSFGTDGESNDLDFSLNQGI